MDLYRKLAFGGIIGVCAFLGLGVLWSGWNNHQLLGDVESAASVVQSTLPNTREFSRRNLEDLDGLRDRLEQLNRWESSRPWDLRFFLYQGDEVADPARKLYFQYFRTYLLDPITKGLAGKLSALPTSQSDTYPYDRTYDELKTYLTVTKQTCAAAPPLTEALMQAWGTWRVTNEDQAQKVRKQFEFYVDELQRKRATASETQEEAIRRGRTYLGAFAGEQLLYSNLREEVNQAVPAVRLGDYAPKYAQVLTGVKDVPGAYTPAGWNEMQDRIASAKPKQESCVLGTPVGQQVTNLMQGPALTNRLHDLYSRDYVQKWIDMLAGVRVLPYGDRNDASKKLQTMDEESTLLGLLFMASENTDVSLASGADSTGSRLAELGKSAGAKMMDSSRTGRIGKAVAGAVARGEGSATEAPPDPKEVFQPVRAVFGPQASRKNFNDPNNANFTRAVSGLYKAMKDLAESGSPDSDVGLNGEAKKAADKGLDAVREIARRFDRGPEGVDDQVKRLLNAPFEAAQGHYVADFGRATAAKLNGAGAALCRTMQPLLQKYPFNGRGTEEASLDEVTRIFSPQTGALYALYQQNLIKLLAKTGKRYMVRADAPQDVKVDPAFLDAFNHLMQVSEALFADGSGTPAMRYRLELLPNPDVRAITLTVDGQAAGQGPSQFLWPGGSAATVVLNVRSIDSDIPVASYTGPWAMFEMMAEADARAPGSREIALSKLRRGQRGQPAPVIVGGKEITVHMRVDDFPGGVENAFDRNFFDCKCVARVAAQ